MITASRLVRLALLPLAALFPIVGTAAPADFQSLEKRPNVVVILADDMGFSDAGCYGGEIATPHLDALAKDGLRFTQFYNTARCWPTRASILSGYYPQQVNRDNLPGLKGGGAQGRRPAWARLLPEHLRAAGYRTYHSGKWHVDGRVLAGGFDHSYSLNDHDRYFGPRQQTLDDQPLPPATNGGFYTTTEIADRAIAMLRGHAAETSAAPFFLYLAFTSPHFPLHAPAADIALYSNRYTAGWDTLRTERHARIRSLGLLDCALSPPQPGTFAHWSLDAEKLRAQIDPGEMGRYAPWNALDDAQRAFQPAKMAVHAAMVHRMDAEIGRVLDQVRSMGAFDNTVVFFASDNGATSEQIIRGDGHDRSRPPGSAGTFLALGPGWSTAANTPFRYHKSWLHEGGIATPLIVHWPAGIAARGELRTAPGHVIDLPPTILELAGAKPVGDADAPPMQGRSLVPVFAKEAPLARDFLWWCHDGNRAIRVGDWKLVADHDAPWELYNLATDRSELKNLADAEPARVKTLAAAWQQHADEFRADATRKP